MVARSDAGFTRCSYIGIFLISLSTLMFEILLTRIFSVTMWYHFAFFAISVAMFGLSAGAILVFLLPNLFSEHRIKEHLSTFSLLFAFGILLSTYLHLFLISSMTGSTFLVNASRAITFVIVSVPFTLSGIVICLALTKFPPQVGRIYAADLCGAASGCLFIIVLLNAIGDAFTVVMAIATLSALAAISFGWGVRSKSVLTAGWICTALLFVATGVVAVKFRSGQPLLKINWTKGTLEPNALYERWNSYSRIKITGSLDNPNIQLMIDASAATRLNHFEGDLSKHKNLQTKLPTVVHYLRPDSRVAIIGSGGGQDVLAAMTFHQKSIVGIEMNKNTLRAVNGHFGDYTGHLDSFPNVRFVNDEARSYITRTDEKFDIIMATLIDTWAATAAGAYALSENSLYTVEGWRTFLQHLTPNGLLSFTRWYGKVPGEMYRMMSIAAECLRSEGIANPLQHIAIVKKDRKGTMIICKQPLSDADLKMLDKLAAEGMFEIIQTPRFSTDPIFGQLAGNKIPMELLDRYPIDLTAPTDDRPFFFNMLKFREVFTGNYLKRLGRATVVANIEAVSVLGTLLIVVVILTFVCILFPLIIKRKKGDLAGSFPLLVFFASIGMGFMLVEISQLQRLTIFLGHPTYSLSVVLFSLLLSSGLGSYTTSGVESSNLLKSSMIRLGGLLAILIIFGAFTPALLRMVHGASIVPRVIISAAIMLPMGFTMGMAFPLGMQFASPRSASLTPWLWGINGAVSVCASVLAIIIAMAAGISFAFWVGFAAYVVAFSSIWIVGSKNQVIPASD